MPNAYALALAALKSANDIAAPLPAVLINGFTNDADLATAKTNCSNAFTAATDAFAKIDALTGLVNTASFDAIQQQIYPLQIDLKKAINLCRHYYNIYEMASI